VVLGVERLRYLVCALCATEWHLPRVRCVSCQATDRLHSLSIDPGETRDADAQPLPGPVRAEVCDACHRYVKLLDLERLPGADAAADDAATIVLDLLVAERGYRRAGPNVLAPVGESG
jgi:FdhE protein